MNSVSQLTLISEHPIPIDEGRTEDLQHSNPMFGDKNDVLHPDELHERYKDVFAENDEWRVFRSHLYGHSEYVFLWNHQLGYGVRFSDEDGSFRNFVQVMMEAAAEVAGKSRTGFSVRSAGARTSSTTSGTGGWRSSAMASVGRCSRSRWRKNTRSRGLKMSSQTESKCVYRCPECGDEVTMNSDVAPDEPACPSCWSGWSEPFPVMER